MTFVLILGARLEMMILGGMWIDMRHEPVSFQSKVSLLQRHVLCCSIFFSLKKAVSESESSSYRNDSALCKPQRGKCARYLQYRDTNELQRLGATAVAYPCNIVTLLHRHIVVSSHGKATKVLGILELGSRSNRI